MAKHRLLTIAALLAALFALVAMPAAADCPPDDPNCQLKPPDSREVNSSSSTSSASTAELDDPGVVSQADYNLPGALARPNYVEVKPLNAGADAPSFQALPIRMRYQLPSDVSCGVQALGMALDGLHGGAPTSTALLDFLRENGMMYDWGTGVEEMAYAASAFGYKGSYAFHGWDMGQLRGELAAGRPVVVSLGANGAGVPGHFATVTGISPDGKWVAYNDPILGRQVISAEEFQRLWGLQGNSGVVVRKGIPPGAPDYTPWVAFAAGLMALISSTPMGVRRLGVGSGLGDLWRKAKSWASSATSWVKQKVVKPVTSAFSRARRSASSAYHAVSGWVRRKVRDFKASASHRSSYTPPPPPTPQPRPTPYPTGTPLATPTPYATPVPRPTPRPQVTPTPKTKSGGSRVSRAMYKSVKQLLELLPSMKAGGHSVRVPKATSILPGGLLTIGSKHSISVSTKQNPGISIDPNKDSVSARWGTPSVTLSKTPTGYSMSAGVTNKTFDVPVDFGEEGTVNFPVKAGSSVSASFEPNGFWGTKVTLDYNSVSMSTSHGYSKISGSSGVYAEFKPGPLALVGVGVLVVGGALLLIPGPFDEAAVAGLLKGAAGLAGAAIP